MTAPLEEEELPAVFRLRMAAGELACGVLLLITALAFLAGAIRLDFGAASLPGPAVFPTLAAGLLAMLALGIVVRSWRSLPHASRDTVAVGSRNSALALIAMLLFALVFETTGFALASFGFLSVLFHRFGHLTLLRAMVVAAGITALAVGLFVHVFDLPLPSGWTQPLGA